MSGARPPRGSLGPILQEQDLLVAVGPGGVGKTTISAAMGLEAARMGRNTLVLTIDPAKRLAQALGLTGLDDQVQEVATDELRGDGVEVPGKLYAAMLDTGRSFDALMARVAPTAQARERILNNRVYRAMAGTLARSHAYIAMERLYEAMADPRFDLVILDTPPTRNAIEILDAPGVLTAFLEENVRSTLVEPVPGSRLAVSIERRRSAAGDTLLVFNESWSPRTTRLRFARGGGALKLWDPHHGFQRGLRERVEVGDIVELDLDPVESLVLTLDSLDGLASH